MARNHLAAGLVAVLALAACGKGGHDDADAAATKKFAALRAHNDSVRKARAAAAAADSVARVRYAACSDSVSAVLAKAPVTKKKKAPTADSVATIVSGACGSQPVTTTLAAATPRAVDTAHAAPAAVAPAVASAAPAAAHDSTPADSLRSDTLAADSSRGHETEVQRETFAYSGGTRDPFGSLMKLKSAGPELGDLQLVGVYQDLRNSANSVAVLREKSTSHRHKVRVGDELGRLRVRQILARDVVFNIEDFGYERQETLSLRKQEDMTP
ncbi:MAG: hypothetical protein ACM3OH_11330 [Bacillota bacterium]